MRTRYRLSNALLLYINHFVYLFYVISYLLTYLLYAAESFLRS